MLEEIFCSIQAVSDWLYGAFDWEIDWSGFNAKSGNGFHLLEIRSQGGFQLRNPNPDFMDFLLTVRLRNSKKDFQNCSREQRPSFC